jgi:hypothetical protein
MVSTRPQNLVEEAERATRLTPTSARSLLGRAVTLNAAQGDLNDLVQYAESNSRDLLEQRMSSAEAERLTSQEERRRGKFSAEGEAGAAAEGDGRGASKGDGEARP